MTVLACSHGTSSDRGRRAVSGLVAALAAASPDRRVEAAFVDVEQPDVPTALSALAAAEPGPITVVPLLLSAGFHVYVDLTEAVTDEPRARLAPALGPDPRLARLLARRLDEAGLRSDDAVVLAAAGSSDRRAVRDCEATAALLGALLGREVTVGYLSASRPPLAEAVAQARATTGARVAVATYLLAPGYFADLTRACGAEIVSEPLLLADGAPPPELVDVVRDRADTHGDVTDTTNG